jgi:hypothetical protein
MQWCTCRCFGVLLGLFYCFSACVQAKQLRAVNMAACSTCSALGLHVLPGIHFLICMQCASVPCAPRPPFPCPPLFVFTRIIQGCDGLTPNVHVAAGNVQGQILTSYKRFIRTISKHVCYKTSLSEEAPKLCNHTS